MKSSLGFAVKGQQGQENSDPHKRLKLIELLKQLPESVLVEVFREFSRAPATFQLVIREMYYIPLHRIAKSKAVAFGVAGYNGIAAFKQAKPKLA